MTQALALLTDEQKANWTALAGPEFKFPERGFGPGFGGRMGGQERKLLKEHDKDNDGKLSADERKAARVAAKETAARGPGGRGPVGPGVGGPGGRDGGGPRRGPGGPGGPGGGPGFVRAEPGKPGPRVSPEQVASYPNQPLYEPTVLRTLFLEFENEDWETELADFHNTDIEVPATLTVDGEKYPGVGVHFRGMSSYGMVPAGSKRSLNVSLEFEDAKQRLYGYKTLQPAECPLPTRRFCTRRLFSSAREHIARRMPPGEVVITERVGCYVTPAVDRLVTEYYC